MLDAQMVEVLNPPVDLGTAGDQELQMVQTNSSLVEGVRFGFGPAQETKLQANTRNADDHLHRPFGSPYRLCS